jgi:hypothetical protein
LLKAGPYSKALAAIGKIKLQDRIPHAVFDALP